MVEVEAFPRNVSSGERWLESISFLVCGGGIIAEVVYDRREWRFSRICVMCPQESDYYRGGGL